MEESEIKQVVEAALMAAGRALSVDDIHKLFKWGHRPDKKLIRKSLKALGEEYADRALELKEVASGFRVQVRAQFSEYMEGLTEERNPRYSRALMETLALIAYRQPITRGEIEDIRGVAVSSNIIRTLLEREWIRGLGHRDVPGKPEMFGTTKGFLDYFNLKRLDELPALSELTDIEGLKVQLDLPEVEGQLVTEGEGAAQPSEAVPAEASDTDASDAEKPAAAEIPVAANDDSEQADDSASDSAIATS